MVGTRSKRCIFFLCLCGFSPGALVASMRLAGNSKLAVVVNGVSMPS